MKRRKRHKSTTNYIFTCILSYTSCDCTVGYFTISVSSSDHSVIVSSSIIGSSQSNFLIHNFWSRSFPRSKTGFTRHSGSKTDAIACNALLFVNTSELSIYGSLMNKVSDSKLQVFRRHYRFRSMVFGNEIHHFFTVQKPLS